jgi:lipoprotein NlpI
VNRGLTHYGAGNMDLAIADNGRALEIDARNSFAYNNRALARQTKGDIAGALADFSRGLELNPRDDRAFNNRGLLKFGQGDLEGALADFNQAISLNPHNADALSHRALVLAEKGDFVAAQADLERAAAQNLFEADYAQFEIWLLRQRQQQTQQANAALTIYLAQRPKDSNTWTGTIGAFLAGQVDESGLLTAAASPRDYTDRCQHCEAWYFAGIKQLLAGNTAGAEDDFRRCVATGCGNYLEYQQALIELKRMGKAPQPPSPADSPQRNP